MPNLQATIAGNGPAPYLPAIFNCIHGACRRGILHITTNYSSRASPRLQICAHAGSHHHAVTMSTDKLTFGPPGSEWIYTKSDRTYDLTRGATHPAPLKVSLTQGPAGTSLLLNPHATALVVVDMQNFFLHPSCRAHPAGLAAVAPLLDTIAACRGAGVRVVWLNWGLTDADLAAMPAGVLRGFARAAIVGDGPAAAGLGVDLGGGRGRCLVAGEWNSAVYEGLGRAGAVAAEDVHCAKNRMSGLWTEDQPLWRYLEGEGKETRTLLFAGVNTDQCVLGTLTNAYNAGWDCVMVEDCCATTTEGAREVCLSNIGVSNNNLSTS